MERFQRQRLEILRSYKRFAKELKRCFANRMEKSLALSLASKTFPTYIKELKDTEPYLQEKELATVHQFLQNLGKSDLLHEQRKTDGFILEINEYYEDGFLEYKEKQKLNQSISIFAGIFIAIILF